MARRARGTGPPSASSACTPPPWRSSGPAAQPDPLAELRLTRIKAAPLRSAAPGAARAVLWLEAPLAPAPPSPRGTAPWSGILPSAARLFIARLEPSRTPDLAPNHVPPRTLH